MLYLLWALCKGAIIRNLFLCRKKNPTDSFSVVISRDFLINYSLANEPLEHQLSGNILRKMNLRLYAHFLRNKNWAMCTTNPINYFLHS